MRNLPRIKASYDKSMLNLSCYPRVLDFEQLKNKKNAVRIGNKSYRLTTMYISSRATLSLIYTAGTQLEKRSEIG